MFSKCGCFTFRSSCSRVGVLGGSFNPAHFAHLEISKLALRRARLDFVVWAICDRNPVFEKSFYITLGQRVSMAKALVSGQKIVLGVTGKYAINAVDALKRSNPGYNLVWIMGDDVWATINKWYRWRDFCRSVSIIVFKRDYDLCRVRSFAHASVSTFCGVNVNLPNRGGRWSVYNDAVVKQSSTMIRDTIKNALSANNGVNCVF